jgi:hypothetical protein
MAPVPIFTSEWKRIKATLSEPFVNALLDNLTTLLAGTFVQIEKQLRLIPTSFQTSNSKHEIIYTTYKANV